MVHAKDGKGQAPSTRETLLQFHAEFCDRARKIMAAKNHDYAGAAGTSPYSNFQAAEHLGVCSTEQGFVVRMLDKLKRLATYAKSGALMVEGEGMEDACLDLVNYSILLAAYCATKAARLDPGVDDD